ncbi:MAG: tetratricopeptide repeat protein [Bacteroidales bacterium]|nr:tetratricopeptide repeat protein [Bacteroidales bacterium]
MMDKENIERIKAYYLGEMNRSERLVFESDLENNSDLKEEYLIYNGMESDLRAMSQIKEALNDANLQEAIYDAKEASQKYEKSPASPFKEMIEEVILNKGNNDYKNIKVTNGKAIRNIFSYIGNAAALILLLIIFGISIMKTNPDKLFEHYYSMAKIEMFHERGIQDVFPNEIQQLYNYYISKDFKNAENTLENISDSLQTDSTVKFLTSLLEMEKENYPEAISLFNENLKPDDSFYEESLWYLGLCYLKVKNLEEARTVFTILKNSTGKYHTESNVLVRKIRFRKSKMKTE